MKTVVCANLAVLVWGAGVVRAEVTITMRGGEKPPAGAVTGVDAGGVAVMWRGLRRWSASLSWDRVAAVDGLDAAAVRWHRRDGMARDEAGLRGRPGRSRWSRSLRSMRGSAGRRRGWLLGRVLLG
jgi:hypothetical protein